MERSLKTSACDVLIGLCLFQPAVFLIQAGARIVVHDRDIFPLVSENGIDATPSNAMNIGIHEVLALQFMSRFPCYFTLIGMDYF